MPHGNQGVIPELCDYVCSFCVVGGQWRESCSAREIAAYELIFKMTLGNRIRSALELSVGPSRSARARGVSGAKQGYGARKTLPLAEDGLGGRS